MFLFRDNSKVEKRPSGDRPPIDHRQIADLARDSGHWALAARHYSEMLKENPQDAGIWLQHGHMMKELGLFIDAGRSYGRALSLAPNDPEIFLQLGFLAKITGDLPEATRYLRQARDLGYQPLDFVEQEIRFCNGRRASAVRASSPDKKRLPLRVYMSSITGLPFDESGGDLRKRFGAAHYSYAFFMKGFIAALEALEVPFTTILNPEYIADVNDFSDAEINVHIGFYPPEEVRFLKGSYNVLSVAWEFERLRNVAETISYHAFADTVRMLGRANEIWSISSYGAEAFRRSGLQRVETVAVPIIGAHKSSRQFGRPDRPGWGEIERAASVLGNISWVPFGVTPHFQTAVNEEAKRRRSDLLSLLFTGDDASENEDGPPIIFLTVFNVHDYRKQIRPLIEAFVQYSQTNRNAYLLFKVTRVAWNDDPVSEQIYNDQMFNPGDILPPFVSDRIWMTGDVLTRDQMLSLYDCAAFYVCTSHAEGQNFPMMEAMARGVVPVSVDNSAMASYIRSDNAIIIPSFIAPFTRRLTQRYGLYGVSTWYSAAEDIYTALCSGSEINSENYVARSAAASRTINDQFGAQTLRAALDRIATKVKASDTGENN
jgi:glycosyltransferase involved in cell wall biosynthesis